MKRHPLVALAALLVSYHAGAAVLFEQPHDASGTLYQSSWWDPDDSDWDQHVWDNFTLPASQAITEIHWRGGYPGQPYAQSVEYFTVAIWGTSIANEPDIVNPPLVEYFTTDDAGQTPAGTFSGVAMYDYHFTLPSAFQATGGVKYWVYILAAQHGIPGWGLARGTGGSNQHFRWLRGAHMYQWITGDAAFALVGADLPTYTIVASASPPEAGFIQGAGQYPTGSSATLVANSNPGWGFWRWTESGVPVSSSASYSFDVIADRTLVADFIPAYSITTASFPTYGGSTSGDGTFNHGSTVTVTAAPNHGFEFTAWTEFGTPASTSAAYTFAADSERTLVAGFQNAPGAVTFTMDSGPQFTSLPIDLTVDGLTAHFSATGSGYSIQAVGAVGIAPPGFSGLCIYPNSVFPADLIIDFSEALTEFSILYSPQELGCDDSATMRVTTYMDGAFVATDTATVPVPGNYPSGTLLIVAPAGFDRAVVHYDSPPPTCQDWGPIFLADNVTAVLALAPCTADVDGDGSVGFSDLTQLLINWGPCPPGPATCQWDVNQDQQVGFADLTQVLVDWGSCP